MVMSRYWNRLRSRSESWEDVIYVTDLTAVDSVCRELMLVKVRVLPENRQSIMAVSSIFHGKVVDVTRDSMIIEADRQAGKTGCIY